MVYHSTPDPNKPYTDHMTNFELTKFEIHNVAFTPDGLIDRVDATVTSAFSHEFTIKRAELIGYFKQQGCGIYFNGKKLILETIGLDQFIHQEKSSEPKDILE